MTKSFSKQLPINLIAFLLSAGISVLKKGFKK